MYMKLYVYGLFSDYLIVEHFHFWMSCHKAVIMNFITKIEFSERQITNIS